MDADSVVVTIHRKLCRMRRSGLWQACLVRSLEQEPKHEGVAEDESKPVT